MDWFRSGKLDYSLRTFSTIRDRRLRSDAFCCFSDLTCAQMGMENVAMEMSNGLEYHIRGYRELSYHRLSFISSDHVIEIST
jgi:hypothetical protein